MKKLENIYLSVIAATRNNNHNDNLEQRTNIFIKSLAENCKKNQIKSMLIKKYSLDFFGELFDYEKYREKHIQNKDKFFKYFMKLEDCIQPWF